MRKYRVILSLFLMAVVSLFVIFNKGKLQKTYLEKNTVAESIAVKGSSDVADCLIDPGLPKTLPGEKIIKHTYYTIGFCPKNKEADWVAYKLTATMVNGNTKRKNNFRTDPDAANFSASPEDYKYSGYDRGHLCPAADMKFSDEAMSETFYMTNVTPQLPGFNRGIWSKLESKVREWANEDGVIYVTTGTVVKKSHLTIGTNKVAVPDYFYKVILDCTAPQIKGIGFIMPNMASQNPLESFAITIDSVESFTGLDFFPALPDSVEKQVEGKVSISSWFR